MLFLESHSFSFRQPSGARGTFSVGSGRPETAILLTRSGFLLRHRERLEIALISSTKCFYYSFGSVFYQLRDGLLLRHRELLYSFLNNYVLLSITLSTTSTVPFVPVTSSVNVARYVPLPLRDIS